MRPAWSVLVFTVSSGAGLGLAILLALADLTDYAGGLSNPAVLIGLAVAAVLVTIGLLSSTLHLANPKNAWRAFSQFKRSWLSREGVFALALYPSLAAYALAVDAVWPFSARIATGVAVIVLALAVLVCTGMIYACLKTIPRWHTPLVPIAYVVLGLYSGALILVAIAAFDARPVLAFAAVAFVLLTLAAIVKGLYYQRFKAPAKSSLAAAVGMPAAAVKLLDAGHSHSNFLTDEFGFRIARERATMLRYLFLAFAFVAPMVVLGLDLTDPFVLTAAALAALAGLLIERWLFFAEAEHVVRLFHGQNRV